MPEWLAQQLKDRDAELLFGASWGSRMAPLFVCGGFFLFTVALVAIGPLDWNLANPALLFGFLLLSAALLAVGYHFGVRGDDSLPSHHHSKISASLLVVLGALVFLIHYPFALETATGKWYPDVWRGLTEAGRAYDIKIYLAEHSSQASTYVGIILAPVTLSVIPLTLFFFTRLSPLARILGITVVIAEIASGVAQATNKSVAETCAYIVLFLVLTAASSTGARAGRRVALCALASVLVVGGFFAYYNASITSRVATDISQPDDGTDPRDRRALEAQAEATMEGLETSSLLSIAERREWSPFFEVVPEQFQAPGMKLTSYLTQGYKGLSMSLEMDWLPTWGLGFSDFVRHNALRFSGDETEQRAFERTYVGRLELEEAWPAGQRWSTFFVHPAADLSFWGVLPLMTVIGWAFGRAWRDTLLRADALACVAFFYLCILVFYLNANNQLFQGGRLAIGFTTLTILWLALRRRARLPAA